MATKAKDTPGLVKEKKKIISSSPSFPYSNNRRKSVTPSAAAAPNYLKPAPKTSTSLDPLTKPSKPSTTTTTLPKPAVARRRSFDNRPPPTSQLQKPAAPPAAGSSRTSTDSVVRPKPRPERTRSSSSIKAPSSSFSSKPKATTTAAGKTIPGKSSRPVATAIYKKKQPQRNAAAKVLKSTSTSDNDLARKSESMVTTDAYIVTDQNDATKSDHEVESEPCQDIHDHESVSSSVLNGEDHDDVNIDSNNELEAEQLLNDDDNLIEPTNDETTHHHTAVVSETKDETQPGLAEPENEGKVVEETEKDNTAPSNTDADELKADVNGNEMTEEKADVNVDEAPDSKEKSAEEDKVVAQVNAEVKSECENSKEKSAEEDKVVAQVNVEVKSQSENTAKNTINNSKSAGGSNNKEGPAAAYNDVIEETAAKLREQRKNRVRALVGAFETVISLQD